VQTYADPDDLADSVAAFLAAGLDGGEPAVVVATAENTERLRLGIADRGVESTQVDALLLTADALLYGSCIHRKSVPPLYGSDSTQAPPPTRSLD